MMYTWYQEHQWITSYKILYGNSTSNLVSIKNQQANTDMVKDVGSKLSLELTLLAHILRFRFQVTPLLLAEQAISGRVNRAYATETVDCGSILS